MGSVYDLDTIVNDAIKDKVFAVIPLLSLIYQRTPDERFRKFMINLEHEVCGIKFEITDDKYGGYGFLEINRRNGKKREIIKLTIDLIDDPSMNITEHGRIIDTIKLETYDNFKKDLISDMKELCAVHGIPIEENQQIIGVSFNINKIKITNLQVH